MINNNDFIAVQEFDFDLSQHYAQLTALDPAQTGAVVMFSGLVRDLDDSAVKAMELEHYPGMTEVCLQQIVHKARARWPLLGVHLVHRVGVLQRHDQIVLVGVASRHRKDAFAASEFIMDYLKQDAPFWKAEITANGKHWVDAKQSDQQADKRWNL
ncbi:MAG: molybdenum cofactor biosynthesis protein MoaE [Gammaproteobacteria bacterium]|jgi:molybdopterin synthase catalytic subunit|nr:molybdenum cofactor biosynthesis protein MoaE [Gammaproteobacteria bacterium]